MQIPSDKSESNTSRFLFAKFQEKEILLEQGRNLFSILNAFASSGYQIMLFNNLPAEKLGKYGKFTYSLDNLTLTDSPPSDVKGWIYLFDKEDKRLGNQLWDKKVRVRYDLFSPYWFSNPIIMPFPVHPAHNKPDLRDRLKRYRSSKKKVRVFFSGDSKGYTRNRIRYPKEKLPRLEVINTIIDRMTDDVLLVKDESILASLANVTYTNKCVLVDTSVIWVNERDWMANMARTDFFLSPPGIVMPMCHNLIEAMAVGTIPVTNYPEWFDPDLTHMENCIVFDDRDDLIEKLKLVLQMEQNQIARIRKNAINYYETYLRSNAFVQRIESSKAKRITILIYIESNVAQKSLKLKKNSILIRGATSARRGISRLFCFPPSRCN